MTLSIGPAGILNPRPPAQETDALPLSYRYAVADWLYFGKTWFIFAETTEYEFDVSSNGHHSSPLTCNSGSRDEISPRASSIFLVHNIFMSRQNNLLNLSESIEAKYWDSWLIFFYVDQA